MVPLALASKQALEGCLGFEALQPKYKNIGAAYLYSNIIGTIRFRDALTAIVLDDIDEQNVDILVEIDPCPVLKGLSHQTR
jgi:hypothetical protein